MISGLIIQHAPGQSYPGGEGQTQHVELPPGPVDRGGEHAKIQYRKVAEQGDMTALAGGRQNRCEKAADSGRHGESAGVLEQGQRERQGDQQDHAGQRDVEAEQAIEPARRVKRQVQTGQSAPLQYPRSLRPGLPLLPAKNRKPQPHDGDDAQAHVQRQQALVGGVFDEECEPDKQHQHPHAQQAVTACEPLQAARPHLFKQAVEPHGLPGLGLGGGRRWRWSRAIRAVTGHGLW